MATDSKLRSFLYHPGYGDLLIFSHWILLPRFFIWSTTHSRSSSAVKSFILSSKSHYLWLCVSYQMTGLIYSSGLPAFQARLPIEFIPYYNSPSTIVTMQLLDCVQWSQFYDHNATGIMQRPGYMDPIGHSTSPSSVGPVVTFLIVSAGRFHCRGPLLPLLCKILVASATQDLWSRPLYETLLSSNDRPAHG